MSGTPPAVHTEYLAPGEGPPMGAFALALRRGRGEALRFLPAPPSDAAGWAACMDAAAAHAPPVPAQLAEALAARQAALGAGEAAAQGARALADPDRPALAVVTGQQPGLLGGPLLTFHKAAGAIALARRLDGVGGHRVVPVFWLASEDHDLDEANRAAVIDRAGQARGLRLPLEGDGRSLVDVAVSAEAVAGLLAELAAALPDTDRGRHALGFAEPGGAEDFATWAARVMTSVLGDSGLVFVEPEQLTPWVGPTYAWLLDHAEALREAVGRRGQDLAAAGLPAPLHPQPADATPLFLRPEPGGRRLRVGLSGETVTLRDDPADLDRTGLRTLLEREPRRASGNVVGRVFVQNRHLPVLAYVAGPTEVAYWAQVRAAHEAVDAYCPLALPRPEATWIDAKASATLGDFGVTPAEVLRGRETPPAEIDEALEGGLAATAEHLEAWPEATRALLARGGQGAQALRRAIDRLGRAWEKAAPGVRAGFAADAGVGRARWARALALLRPHGKPQERLLSPLSLVARYGVEPVRAGLASLDPLEPVHHLVHLGEDAPAGAEESA